jgi:hypothetical protein
MAVKVEVETGSELYLAVPNLFLTLNFKPWGDWEITYSPFSNWVIPPIGTAVGAEVESRGEVKGWTMRRWIAGIIRPAEGTAAYV